MYSSSAPSNSYPFYTQPMHPLPNTPAYPNHGLTCLFVDSIGCVIAFVCWIEDYRLPDKLKMPSHVGSYDGKRDPDNYLHLFEGAIRMQKWAMPALNEEAVKSGQLAQLVKGIKKGKAKVSDTKLGVNNSSDPVIVKVQVSKRQVYRVYMDNGRSCEVIVLFLKIDSKVPLVDFLGEHSWPLAEVPLEITIGESPFARTKDLNFLIVRSDSPRNILLGRTAMQRMSIVVSKIYEAIKFYTPRGIGTVFLTYEPDKIEEG
nr:reverse transcriptase domain-containing protein [Tanacetum cinerariifolium]